MKILINYIDVPLICLHDLTIFVVLFVCLFVSPYKTSLTLALCIEVPVPVHEFERVCIYDRAIDYGSFYHVSNEFLNFFLSVFVFIFIIKK